MMLDIKEGDVLVVGTKEYPIKHVSEWVFNRPGQMSLSSFARFSTVQASTKRPPTISANGLRGTSIVNLANLYCFPLDPVDPEVRRRLALETPHELLQTFVSDNDAFYVLVLEDLKR